MERVEGEILHYKLMEWFPHTIKRVSLYYVPERNERMAIVEFKNNYRVVRSVTELFSTECHAMCIMVHDLPMKDDDSRRES